MARVAIFYQPVDRDIWKRSLIRFGIAIAAIVFVAFAAWADFNSIAPPQIRLLDDPGPVLEARFGKAPPPGIHPRVLIGPEELLSLRQLVQNTVTGKFVLGRAEIAISMFFTYLGSHSPPFTIIWFPGIRKHIAMRRTSGGKEGSLSLFRWSVMTP